MGKNKNKKGAEKYKEEAPDPEAAEAEAEASKPAEKKKGFLESAKDAAKSVARDALMIDPAADKKAAEKAEKAEKAAEGASGSDSPKSPTGDAADLRPSASAKMSAEVPEILSQSAYEEAMSENLPEIHRELDYDEAKAGWKEAAVTDRNGQYIPVCASTLNDLEPLGPGIGLWFRTLKSLGLYFLLMSLPIGLMLAHYLYLYYNDDSDMDEDTMEVLARLTTGVAATTTQEDTINGWDVRTVMLAIACLDCFAVLCFLIMVAHLKRMQTAYVDANDDAVTSLPDYSIMVWNIPGEQKRDTKKLEKELAAHFEIVGGPVADVVVTEDQGKVMAARLKRAEQLDVLIDKKIGAARAKLAGKNIDKQLAAIEKQKEKIRKTNDLIEEKKNEGFVPVCAFITFNEPESRGRCVDRYQKQWALCYDDDLLFRPSKLEDESLDPKPLKLKVKPAPEASDIMWENVLRITTVVRWTRKLISFLCIFILCMGAIGVLVYAKDTVENAPPSVGCPNTQVSDLNPTPNLNCAAIWDLEGEMAATNATSGARLAVTKFVDNVDVKECRQFISGSDWIRPMTSYAADGYSVAQIANLPADGEAWTGGFIAGSQADECAALTCKKCYCTSSADISSMLMDYMAGTETDSGNFCKDIYDQMFLETSVMLGTIVMTTATNMILMASAGLFSQFERHKTISATEANCAKYTFAALFVNQAMVPVIIYSFIEILEGFPVLFQGQFTDFETGWYNKVMVTIMSTAFVNVVAFPVGAAVPNIIAAVLRQFTGCCANSQKALNKMYLPAEFSLSKRYGQMLCATFYTIIFLAAAPPMIPAASLLFFTLYITDKWILLKFSKRPPMYDGKLNGLFLYFAPYAAWVHLALASWAFGYYEIPSYIVDPGSVAGDVGVDAGAAASLTEDQLDSTDLSNKPAQFDIIARLVRANALIPFLMFIVVTVALFFTKLVDGLLAPVIKVICGEKEEKVDAVPPFNELIFPGDARYEEESSTRRSDDLNDKLSGLRSYRLEDNPDYMKLFPEVLSADNAGPGLMSSGKKTPNKGKKPDEAPAKQNMA